jgi:glutamate/tyrosine decarboxylase-like PLP-dependent enzyme
MNERTRVLLRAAERADDYLAAIDARPVRATATGAELRQALAAPLGAAGTPHTDVIDVLAESGRAGTVATQGPRYFGFVVGGSYPVATAADWLVSAWDQNCGIYALSPIVSVIEQTVGSWVCDIGGLPPGWSVGFVTGCQMANFTALAVARHHVLGAAGWDVEAKGLFNAPAIDVFVSDESHYTIFNAIRLLGLGAERLHRIPTDDQGRMRASALADALGSGHGPCIVCAQAGNVNTGSFDPIEAIADLTKARGAWLHVDGAFGFWASASMSLKGLVRGIDRADSIATDAHKWLNVPYDSGLVLTAHPLAHRRAMTVSAAYIVENPDERDPHEFVPEESRRARAVPIYAVLRTLGRDGLADLVERNCRQARRMADRLRAHPALRVLNEVVLNQVLVRVEHDGRDGDALTRAVIARVQEDGTCWLGGTTWHGLVAMRISISNWSTSDDDIDRSAAAIARMTSEVI